MADRTSTTATSGERQVLNRVDRGLRCSEEELRYPLERKDARPPELLDVRIDLEARGSCASHLTASARAVLERPHQGIADRGTRQRRKRS